MTTVETSGQSAEIQVQSEIGSGSIWFKAGCLVDAQMGGLAGESALIALLSLDTGGFEVRHCPVHRPVTIRSNVTELLAQGARRRRTWTDLLGRIPGLGAVFSVNDDVRGELGWALEDHEIQLLELIDGKRSILEVLVASGRDAVEALGQLATLLGAGLFRVKRRSAWPHSSEIGAVVPQDPAVTTLAGEPPADPAAPEQTSSEPTPSRYSSRPNSVEVVFQSADQSASARPLHDALRGTLRGYGPPVDLSREGWAHAGPQAADQGPPSTLRGFAPPAAGPYLNEAPLEVARGFEAQRSSSYPPTPLTGHPDPQAEPWEAVSTGHFSGFADPALRTTLRGHPAPGSASDDARTSNPAALRWGLDRTGTLLGHPPPPAPAVVPSAVDSHSREEGLEPATPALASPPIPNDTKPPPAQACLGRYEVLTRIGRGGMGSVYLCRVTGEAGFRRLFALKVLRARLRDDPESAELFLQEARIAARVHHPNVVAVVDASVQGTQPYLVMDYVEGCSLHTLLEGNPAYRPPELILAIILDALNGLHAIHTLTAEDNSPLGLVHCDISPDNLLVGVDGACRISDFGITRMRSAGLGSPSNRGKAAFLAPERAAGRQVDQRADLFSMGVVLYNALTGVRLFQGESIEETLHNLQTAQILPPSRVGLCPPEWLDAVCMAALARNPHARYSSADEMMFELKRVTARHELLTRVADVAMWVRRTVGPDLQLRRLATLDGSRRLSKTVALTQAAELPNDKPEGRSQPPPAVEVASNTGRTQPTYRGERIHSEFPEKTPPLRKGAGSAESPAPVERKVRAAVLIVASVLAVAAVVVCYLWPGAVGEFFSVDHGTMPVSVDDPTAHGDPSSAENAPRAQSSARANAAVAVPGPSANPSTGVPSAPLSTPRDLGAP